MDECGNYFIEDIGERLGRGGFGEVYKCYVYNKTRDYRSTYARKYFSPSPENDNSYAREVANLRERFLIEIKTQYSLNNLKHSAIAPIVLFKDEGEKPYFIMELATCNLRECINAGMSSDEKANAVIRTLKGVKLIHENNYIHRDLKPENILYYGDGAFKISDFGLVKDMDTIRAEVKTRFNPHGIGTDGYRAPEIGDKGVFSVQTDIYALGKIICDIYADNTPPKVKDIIAKCSNYFPDARYGSVEELLIEFRKAVKLVTEIA
ncbi:serine/threonine protein kinase [Vibrio vulnificus]|uniref:serine/threonine protein kinase n=1 Tax=Vibrio vulnificus TaxID=672 RepID=UPI0021DAD75B|nr:serine/threonine protein kinase [Vibrio vulnificus]MCU8429381.1 serine/threonine protein kinase [Vibrio vulnificus]